ncbi:hypothetical protein BU15DRAFT_63641 [Melanogaster broomeanus]|nr:hypothetical protein BU15DRAFT_63641 [Melanogaster broomeanus]
MKRAKSTWVGVDQKKNATVVATLVTHAQGVDVLCSEDMSTATTSGVVADLQTDPRLDEPMQSPPPSSVGNNNDTMISPRVNIPSDVSMLSPPPMSPPLLVQQPRSLTVR